MEWQPRLCTALILFCDYVSCSFGCLPDRVSSSAAPTVPPYALVLRPLQRELQPLCWLPMKFLGAIGVYLLLGVVLAAGILLAAHGRAWLLILGGVAYLLAFARFGCAAH
jgi:hypothetical protein